MPQRRRTRRTRKRTSYRRRRMRGGSLKSWLRKANRFLRRYKVVSRAGNILGKLGLPYASQVGKLAGAVGYGKRGRRRVKYRRTGGALKLAGMGRRRRSTRCCR